MSDSRTLNSLYLCIVMQQCWATLQGKVCWGSNVLCSSAKRLWSCYQGMG